MYKKWADAVKLLEQWVDCKINGSLNLGVYAHETQNWCFRGRVTEAFRAPRPTCISAE